MPLRDLLITGIVGIALPVVFRHVFVGVLLWTWVGVMNPHKLAFGYMHDAPIAIIIGAVTLVALFTTRDRVRLPWSASLVYIGLLVVWTCITTVFAFFPVDSLTQLEKVLKIQLMVFVAAAVLYKWEHIRLFLWINVLSLAYYGIKGGIFTIRTGGGERVWGPPGGFIAGNNELALALIIAIPLMNFLRLTTPYPWVKRALLVTMALSAASAIGTQSRGALIAIVAMGVVLWWRGPNKLASATIVAILAMSLWSFMPKSWHDRMDTIRNYEQDGSAMGRIFAWQTAINVANDRITGAGFNMSESAIFSAYAPDQGDSKFNSKVARAAHSIYFQILGEHGYIGLFLFVMVWITGWRKAGNLRRGTRDDPDVRWLYHFGSMAQVSLVGWITGGAFLSLAYWDLPYTLVVLVIVAQRWQRERQSMPEVESLELPKDLAKMSVGRRLLWRIRTA